MKWEAKELPDGRWGVFLCKKFWKFKDRPVMYSAAVNRRAAESRVNRLNNPGMYSFDEKWAQLRVHPLCSDEDGGVLDVSGLCLVRV